MQMPVMDGLDATRAIRLKPEFQLLPIIAMTANVMANDRDKCTDAGMNDHLSKPIDPDALFATLLRWIKPRDNRSTPAETSVTRADSVSDRPTHDALPQISGIDTKTALRRTGGNLKRYEMLLGKFGETNAIKEIRSALAAGDKPTAERAAHSLKGAAANLGATAVADEAAKVESAIATGNDPGPLIASLAISLNAVVAAIGSALPSEPAADLSAPSSAANAESVLQPLHRLQKLLKSDDGEAGDFILEAKPALAKVLSGTEISALSGFIGNFDFDGALKCLSEIAARLAIQLE
jgi:two-component system, sensor histidine kinase and response regulator